MGRKKDLGDCRYDRDFIKWAQRRGATVRRGGRHTKIYYDGQHVAVPSGEVKKGTRHSIIKSLVKMGLVALFWALAAGVGAYAALFLT